MWQLPIFALQVISRLASEEHATTTLGAEHNTHDVSEVDLLKGEGFECRAELADSRLDGFLQVLLHVHSKERPGLLQHLDTHTRGHTTKALSIWFLFFFLFFSEDQTIDLTHSAFCPEQLFERSTWSFIQSSIHL